MTRSDERRLHTRLARVVALREGATTPGEREAAANAEARLRERLAASRREDPVARSCAEEVASLGVEGPLPEPEPDLADVDVLWVLALYERGALPLDELRRWALDLVDAVVFPDHPAHPLAPLGEVLLQLSTVDRFPLLPSDVPRVREFLSTGDWRRWFETVAHVAGRSPRSCSRVARAAS